MRSNLLSSIEIASALPRNDNEESLNLGISKLQIKFLLFWKEIQIYSGQVISVTLLP